MTTPEGKLKEYLLKRCRALDFKCYKLNFENRRGAPDWMICGNGKTCFIELKTRTGIISPAQKSMICELNTYGGVRAWICRSEQQIDGALGGLCYV